MYGDVSADVSVTVAAGFWVKNMAAEHAESSSMDCYYNYVKFFHFKSLPSFFYLLCFFI